MNGIRPNFHRKLVLKLKAYLCEERSLCFMNFSRIYVLKREILPSYFFLDKILFIEEDQFIFLPSLFTIFI